MLKKLKAFLPQAPKLKRSAPMTIAQRRAENDRIHNENMENIALAEFELQKEAMQHNLNLAHRISMIALLAVLVSILAIIISLGK